MNDNAPQYVEQPCVYVFQRSLTANQALQSVPVVIDGDSEFLWTGLHGSSTGSYTLNIQLPDGKRLINAQVQNGNLVSTSPQTPTPIGPNQTYKPKSIGPALDLTDTSGAGNTIELCFDGIRRIRVG